MLQIPKRNDRGIWSWIRIGDSMWDCIVIYIFVELHIIFQYLLSYNLGICFQVISSSDELRKGDDKSDWCDERHHLLFSIKLTGGSVVLQASKLSLPFLLTPSPSLHRQADAHMFWEHAFAAEVRYIIVFFLACHFTLHENCLLTKIDQWIFITLSVKNGFVFLCFAVNPFTGNTGYIKPCQKNLYHVLHENILLKYTFFKLVPPLVM